jgi:hypothetical protein
LHSAVDDCFLFPAKSALRKWLVIAFIDILLNTPENLYRILTLLDAPNESLDEDEYHYAARIIAQVKNI